MTAFTSERPFDPSDRASVNTVLDEVDTRIRDLGAWTATAAEALLTFWEGGNSSVFARNSLPEVDDRSATSTYRAICALTEFLRTCTEPDGVAASKEVVADARACIGAVADRWLGRLPADLDEIRGKSANRTNMFTDSQMMMAVAMLDAMALHTPFAPSNAERQEIRSVVAKKVARERIRDLAEWGGGRIDVKDPNHDFVTLHVVRSLDALKATIGDSSLWEVAQPQSPGSHFDGAEMRTRLGERIRLEVLQHLGFKQAGVGARFDPAELMFSASLLTRVAPPDGAQLLEPAVRAVTESQTHDGAWPTARIVSYEHARLLHVASFEVALALTGLLSQQIRGHKLPFAVELLAALDRSVGLVSSSFTVVGSMQGWANDRIRWTNLVECWATAVVLTLLIRYRDALADLRQQLVLRRYKARARRTDSRLPWPDLYAPLRSTRTLPEHNLARVSDPSEEHSLVAALRSKVLEPIVRSPVRRPYAASMIIYGPPGTRKTTLVSELANALDWPLLTLSPPVFLHDGLDGLEAAADEVFTDLQRLRRVVVLFDECEDFFKNRDVDDHAPLEARTLGAFITSGMLPRLQALRDRQAVLFVLATNSSPESLDSAVTRPGRFDYTLFLGHPVPPTQISYAERRASEQGIPSEATAILKAALIRYSEQLQDMQVTATGVADGDTPPVSFGVIDQVLRQLKSEELKADPAAIDAELVRLVQAGPRALL